MKIFLVFLMTANLYAQNSKVIHSSDALDTPESTYFDSKSGFLYISNVSGEGLDFDNKSWISKHDKDGNLIKKLFATSNDMHAPKGLTVVGDTLYTADINKVIAFDVNTGQVLKSIYLKNAIILNDLTASKDTLYVSDTMGQSIYSIDIKTWTSELVDKGEHLESPNGLYLNGDELIVAGWGKGIKDDWSTDVKGSLYSLNLKTKKKTILVDQFGNLDGVERSLIIKMCFIKLTG